MPKTIIFEDDIDQHTVTRLIKKLEAADTVTLYFSSFGGHRTYQQILSDYLVRHQCRIELLGFFTLYSAGFNVYYNFPGAKQLLPGTIGLLHQSSVDVSSRDLGRSGTIAHVQNTECAQFNQQQFEQFQPFLTAEEQTLFQAGQDVVLSYDRMQQIFP